MSELPEIIFVDKPIGMTSFDVIRELRKKTGIRKFGHAGTLDPLATGLMILGVEKGTKRLEEFIKLDKEYVAEVRVGESRTTDDLEGEIVEESEVKEIKQSEISSTVQSLVGTLRLPVSAYSAIKKDGKPMYKRAREAEAIGEVVTDVPVRDMVVLEAQLLDTQAVEIAGKRRLILKIRFHVASGVYIRSLARELGKRLGYPATIQSLRRTKVGEYDVKDALFLDAI
jgi:tRNA pseudouridine55 synthase